MVLDVGQGLPEVGRTGRSQRFLRPLHFLVGRGEPIECLGTLLGGTLELVAVGCVVVDVVEGTLDLCSVLDQVVRLVVALGQVRHHEDGVLGLLPEGLAVAQGRADCSGHAVGADHEDSDDTGGPSEEFLGSAPERHSGLCVSHATTFDHRRAMMRLIRHAVAHPIPRLGRSSAIDRVELTDRPLPGIRDDVHHRRPCVSHGCLEGCGEVC